MGFFLLTTMVYSDRRMVAKRNTREQRRKGADPEHKDALRAPGDSRKSRLWHPPPLPDARELIAAGYRPLDMEAVQEIAGYVAEGLTIPHAAALARVSPYLLTQILKASGSQDGEYHDLPNPTHRALFRLVEIGKATLVRECLAMIKRATRQGQVKAWLGILMVHAPEYRAAIGDRSAGFAAVQIIVDGVRRPTLTIATGLAATGRVAPADNAPYVQLPARGPAQTSLPIPGLDTSEDDSPAAAPPEDTSACPQD